MIVVNRQWAFLLGAGDEVVLLLLVELAGKSAFLHIGWSGTKNFIGGTHGQGTIVTIL